MESAVLRAIPDWAIGAGVTGRGAKSLVWLALGVAASASGQGVWERRADFPLEAFGVAAATVFGQKLYAVCGMTAKGASTSMFVYDPAVDQWMGGPALPIAGGAQDCNVAASGGSLYVLGAAGGGGAVDGWTYRFDPTEREWRVVGQMPTPRAASGVAVSGTRIYVAGGMDGGGRISAALEMFDTETRVWTRLPDMPTARDHLTAKAIRGLVYAIGGRGDGALGTNEEYNAATRSWRARAAMPTARSRLASGRSNGRIQVFGGEGACGPNGVCAQNEEYDPAANTWRALAPLPSPRHSLSGTTIDGRVFTVGGGPRGGASFSGVLEALHLPAGAPPSIGKDGIVNAASLQPGLSPGALASLFGQQLSQGRQASFFAEPPTALNAVTVKWNGAPVPLVYVDSAQINFLVPLEASAGPAEVTVTNAGADSAKVTVSTVAQYSPAIFSFAGTGSGQGVVLIAGTGLIAGGRKTVGYRLARRGEVVEIYCTGLGPVRAAAGSARATTTEVPAVTIGGAPAEVLFSGPVAGLPGVYQVNARIPVNASTGLAVAVTLRIGPAATPASNEVTIGIL
jgi:uncharacterized protein (TIGR03437 family)